MWCPGPWGPVGDALKAAGISVLDHSLDLSGSAAVDELLGWLEDLRASIFYSFASDSIWVDAELDPSLAYRRMTLYIHSSLSEGLPGAVLEAMSHGLAVVGILVPPADAGALAQAMTELSLR